MVHSIWWAPLKCLSVLKITEFRIVEPALGWHPGFSPNLGVFTPLSMLSCQMPEEWLGLEELFLAWHWGPWGLHEDGEGRRDLIRSRVQSVKISCIHPHGFVGEWRAQNYLRLTSGFNGAEWRQREPETPPGTPWWCLESLPSYVALSSQWKLGEMLWVENRNTLL